MTNRELVIKTAMEWWDSLGKRFLSDLRALIAQGCDNYAIPEAEREEMTREAWERIPHWKVASRQRRL